MARGIVLWLEVFYYDRVALEYIKKMYNQCVRLEVLYYVRVASEYIKKCTTNV